MSYDERLATVERTAAEHARTIERLDGALKGVAASHVQIREERDTLRARLTAAEGLLREVDEAILEHDDDNPGLRAVVRAFLAAPPGRRETTDFTNWPQPAPAPEACGTCGLEPGTGLVQPQDKGFPVPCPTCQGQQGPEFTGDSGAEAQALAATPPTTPTCASCGRPLQPPGKIQCCSSPIHPRTP